jgi:hypothetical protein
MISGIEESCHNRNENDDMNWRSQEVFWQTTLNELNSHRILISTQNLHNVIFINAVEELGLGSQSRKYPMDKARSYFLRRVHEGDRLWDKMNKPCCATNHVLSRYSARCMCCYDWIGCRKCSQGNDSSHQTISLERDFAFTTCHLVTVDGRANKQTSLCWFDWQTQSNVPWLSEKGLNLSHHQGFGRWFTAEDRLLLTLRLSVLGWQGTVSNEILWCNEMTVWIQTVPNTARVVLPISFRNVDFEAKFDCLIWAVIQCASNKSWNSCDSGLWIRQGSQKNWDRLSEAKQEQFRH